MKKRISHDEEYFYRKLISGMITAINVFLLFIIIVGEWKFEYPWKEENCIKNIFLIIVIFILGMGIFYIVNTIIFHYCICFPDLCFQKYLV